MRIMNIFLRKKFVTLIRFSEYSSKRKTVTALKSHTHTHRTQWSALGHCICPSQHSTTLTPPRLQRAAWASPRTLTNVLTLSYCKVLHSLKPLIFGQVLPFSRLFVKVLSKPRANINPWRTLAFCLFFVCSFTTISSLSTSANEFSYLFSILAIGIAFLNTFE